MKRLILTLVVILISTNILHAAKFKWKKISTNTEDDIFYLDKNTVYRIGDYIYYWMLVDYYEAVDELQSTITHNMVKCNTLENRPISFAGFTKKKGRGETMTGVNFIVPEEVPDMFKWDKYTKKSTHGAVLEEVCKIK
ncbi:hypothetical protein N9S92_01360 [Candidatus Pelagibacter sp.]|nr:hypothetical protein [Candidatus Pelagibacter sp.]